jgi:ribose transport system substrate-binding protein
MQRSLAGAFLACALAATAVEAQAPQKGLKIGLVAKSSANFVFLAARTGAEDEARALSVSQKLPVEILWRTPPHEDPAAQAENLAQAVRDGANAILISCSDAAALRPAIDAAVARGVPVMTFDSDAPASKRFAFYGTDDDEIGEKVMTDLAEQLGGKGKVAILAGNPEAPNLKARAEAVRKAAGRFPGIEVVEVVHHEETPQAAAAAVLRVTAAHPDLVGWAMVGGWPLFRSSETLQLMSVMQARKLKVVAVDALPDQLSYVDRGLVAVLWAQPLYLWGKVGVDTIFKKVVLQQPVPEITHMELVRVTKDTLGSWARQLKSWGFQGVPDAYLKEK